MNLPARNVFVLVILCSGIYFGGCATESNRPEEGADPPEIALGERLFLETRFAQFFAQQSGSDVNQALTLGDPVVAESATLDGSVLVKQISRLLACACDSEL